MALFKVWVTRSFAGGCYVHARKVKGYPVTSPRGSVGFSTQHAPSAAAAKRQSGFARRPPPACREGVLGGVRRRSS